MNKKHLVFEIVLLVLVALLYVYTFACPSARCAAPSTPASDSAACQTLPIAYVNVDTLILNYEFASELEDQLMRKRENSQANFNQKARQFEQEATDFQRKLENNAFLSEQRARSEQERLQKKQQELQELDQRLSNELAAEMQAMNLRLNDSIFNYLLVFNADKKYQLILSNNGSDNVLVGQKIYNITDEVTEGLNRRYQAGQSKKRK